MERTSLQRIGKRFAINLQERPLPSDEDVERIVAERIITLLEARLRSRDKLQTERMQRFLPLARSLGAAEGEHSEETGLLAMLLDDFYQENFLRPLVPPASEDAAPAPQRAGRPKRPRRAKGMRSRRG